MRYLFNPAGRLGVFRWPSPFTAVLDGQGVAQAMSCSYPNCPCGYKSPLCDEYPPKPSQPQPAASSAVEQAIQNLKLAIENCRLEPACEADWQIKALIAAVRAESCPACAEKDQQLASAEAEIARLREVFRMCRKILGY